MPGKAGVPPAVVYKSPLMQAGRLLYPLRCVTSVIKILGE